VLAGVARVRRSRDVRSPGGAVGAVLRRQGSWSCGRGPALVKTLAGGARRLGPCVCRVWYALGECRCQCHVGGMTAVSSDVAPPVGGVILEHHSTARVSR
jgi:hypothetical protein